jgi:hypothetical protein
MSPYWSVYRLRCKRTANVPQDEFRMLRQGGAVAMDSLQQGRKGRPLLVVGDLPARPAPAPCNAIGVRGVGRRRNEPQVGVPLGQPLAHQLGACGRMGAEVIHEHERQTALGA